MPLQSESHRFSSAEVHLAEEQCQLWQLIYKISFQRNHNHLQAAAIARDEIGWFGIAWLYQWLIRCGVREGILDMHSVRGEGGFGEYYFWQDPWDSGIIPLYFSFWAS